MKLTVEQLIGIVQVALALATIVFGRSILEWYSSIRNPIRLIFFAKHNFDPSVSDDFGWDVQIVGDKDLHLEVPIYLYLSRSDSAIFGLSSIRENDFGVNVNVSQTSSGLVELLLNFLPAKTILHFSFYCTPSARPLVSNLKGKPIVAHYGLASAPYTRELLTAHVRILVIVLLFAQATIASLLRIIILGT